MTVTIERPAHIDADRWQRAPWHARQKLIDAANRDRREHQQRAEHEEAARQAREDARIAHLIAQVEKARAEHEARYGVPMWNAAGEQTRVTPTRKPVVSCHERAAQVEMLLEVGRTARQIVAQLDMKAGTLRRAMERAKRYELASVFGPLVREEQMHPCEDCGKRVDRGSKRCRSCASLHRQAGRRAA